MPFRIDPENPPLARPGIYLIRNLLDGAGYVGISQDLLRRSREHARGKHGDIGKVIRKLGAHQFSFVPIYYPTQGYLGLAAIEASLIVQYDTIENGYNVYPITGGLGRYNAKFAAKMRETKAANPTSAKTRAAVAASNRARVHSPETKAKLSAASLRRKGLSADGLARLKAPRKPLSEEHRAKLRAANQGKPFLGPQGDWTGKNHTEETRAKMRAAALLVWQARRARGEPPPP